MAIESPEFIFHGCRNNYLFQETDLSVAAIKRFFGNERIVEL
jgi:hypothetical protein